MATTNPLIDYKMLDTQGQTSYTDPITGKIVYLNRIDPNKDTNLTPMDLSNPTAIPKDNTAISMDSLVQSLFKSMAPSAAPGSTPMTYDLPGIFSSMTAGLPAVGEQNFQDYVGLIEEPSSVDAVQKSLENDQLTQLMAEIDRQTKSSLAGTKLDALDRGIGGPGQYGDIEANALAQVRTGGERNKTAGMLQAYQAELSRQKAREEAVNAAYGQRYTVGAAADTQARTNVSDLLGKQYAGNITQSESAASRASAQKMNYFNQILDYAVKSGTLNQQDAQFYAKLISDENTAAAARDNAYQIALLGTRGKSKDWMDYLSAGAGIFKDVAGGAKDIYGGGNPVLP